jgi:ribosomal protein S18 acetylase RimI-like enzyme
MFQFRRAGPQDAETVNRFTALAFAEEGSPAPGLHPDVFRRDACTKLALIEAFLAEDAAQRPAGIVVLSKGYDIHRGLPTVVVLNLFVLLEHRRSGLARQLIAQVAARAMELGAKELTITTGVSNDIARRFFESIGAREDRLSRYLMEADEIEWLAEEGR